MFHHVTVLLKETVDNVVQSPHGIYVDMTLGGGGHSHEIASRLAADGCLIGIDRDEEALQAARQRLEKMRCRIHLVQRNYIAINEVVNELGFTDVDGIVCDLGVSSYQLDTEERGFSYQHDTPLDMRMDQRQELTAAMVVNTYSAKELSQVIREYGEERFANRIAQRIVARREDYPLTTTGELVEVIKAAIPAAKRRTGPHPAKRTFQAIRIEVNGELRDLEMAVRNAVRTLKPGGKIGIISFHSLEDRIIKHTFRDLARECICPPELPVCQCGHQATLRNVSKAIRPTEQELEDNPRARSAILRVAEKV